MHFLWSIILGAIAGTIAEKVMNFNLGWIMTIVLGIVGGIAGDFLLGVVGLRLAGGTIDSLISAVIGAIVVLFGYKAIAGKS